MRINNIPVMEQMNSISPQVLEGRFAELTPDWKLNLHSTPYSRLYYFTEGEAWIEYNGITATMKAGEFYLIPAGLSFRAGCHVGAKSFIFM